MRKAIIFVWCLTAAWSLTGCTKQLQELARRIIPEGASAEPAQDGDEAELLAVKSEEDTTYHNSYLGFSYTVPKGWWAYRLYQDNFSPDPDETADPGSLDIQFGENAGKKYRFIDLASFANLQFSTRDNHLGFYFSAETLENVNSLAEYMEYYENYMLEPDTYEYQLSDSGQEEINGLVYERRIFEVIREEDNYYYITFTRPVANGYYLTLRASYWPANTDAEELIISALSRAMK